MRLIENLFGSKSKIGILRKLSIQKDWNFSISELARDLNLNKALVSRVIKELEKDNVVKIIQKGRTKLVKLNEKNIFIKNLVLNAFRKERELQSEIEKNIVKILEPGKLKIISIISYGSFAKDKFKLSSDIDIMIAAKRQTTKIKNAIEKATKYFADGDLIVFFDVIKQTELKRLYKEREPSIIDISKNHKILYGKEILEMV